MPDKNYNVDDILQEIRRKQGGASRDASAPKPKKQAPRASLPEEDEDVVEYQPSRPKASRREEPEPQPRRKARTAPQEDWPGEEDEEDYEDGEGDEEGGPSGRIDFGRLQFGRDYEIR